MKKKIVIIGAFVTIAIIFLSGCTSSPQNGSNSNSNFNTPSLQTQTEIFIKLANLSTKAKFYSFNSNGTNIRYFAVQDSSGNVHIAFDACDVCYEAKKGYQQNGEMMQCKNCGKEFAITGIGVENTGGGCWPSYLPMRIENDTVVIKISDLEEKSYMF